MDTETIHIDLEHLQHEFNSIFYLFFLFLWVQFSGDQSKIYS